MTSRFMMFVDGSNLFGTARGLEINFEDYELLYQYLFDECLESWKLSFSKGAQADAQLIRIYWYVVGTMDQVDAGDPKTQNYLRQQFERDREISPLWHGLATQSLKERGIDVPDDALVADESWSLYLKDFQGWYERKRGILAGMNRFHYAVESSTDFIEIRRVGHWKVDVLHKTLVEKGVDTSFAVDMVTMLPAYDVALLISGDADGIPSVTHVKNSGRQVGTVEFVRGAAPEHQTKNLSSRLRTVADFVTPIYEANMVRDGVAARRAR